jgi:hypothetical protein
MRIALTVLVGLVALLMLPLGVQWMFSPGETAEGFGITLIGQDALSTARGDLGGMFLAGAAMAVIGLVTGNATWLRALALLLGMIALGRVVGFAQEGMGPEGTRAFVAEILMCAVLLARVWHQSRAAGRAGDDAAAAGNS